MSRLDEMYGRHVSGGRGRKVALALVEDGDWFLVVRVEPGADEPVRELGRLNGRAEADEFAELVNALGSGKADAVPGGEAEMRSMLREAGY